MVIRAMPNTACRVRLLSSSARRGTQYDRVVQQIREGMTVVSNLPPSDSEGLNKEIILQIFSSIGRCRFLEEKHFDACTALSGSGPAFACIFLEAMTDGGVMMGLPRAEALELAAQCACACGFYPSHSPIQRRLFHLALQGAARMALQPDAHPAQIKDSVTSESVLWLGRSPCDPTHAY